MALTFRWHLQTVAAIYQGLGVALTTLGLAAIGDRIRGAVEATTAAFASARSGVGAWGARRREQLAVLWARLTHRPRRSAIIPVASAQGRGEVSGSLTVQVTHHRVDRNTISVRDWLVDLDDRLESVLDLLGTAEQRRYEERQEFDRRLGIQRDELRAEIVRETRNGWQIVVWGLGYTFIGVVLGGFA